jgi:light-regulated signal transduction histidine kinase (bacteriophytochrome)
VHPNFPSSGDIGGSKSPGSRATFGTKDRDEQRKVTEGSQYISLKTGPPRVLIGSTADKAKPAYRRCEDEPIHTPGAIQSFGALVGLKYNEHDHLDVRIASENSRKVLGYGPEQLFALSSFLDVLRDDIREEMLMRVKHALSDADAVKGETQLDVFQIILTFPFEPELRLWCAIHIAPKSGGLVICEFEEFLDAFHLKDMGAAKIVPVTPTCVTGYDASPEELEKSTTSASKPLLGVEIARQKQNEQFSSLDLFNTITQAQNQIAGCKSVQSVLEVVVGIVAELTGFHRVMFYRFDSQMNGCVEAELLNPRASTDIYRGKLTGNTLGVAEC